MQRPPAHTLLVVTGLWPTRDRPGTGTFVQQRLAGVPSKVVGPRTYSLPMPFRYLDIAWRALTARGRFHGVEAHVLFPAGLVGLLAARMRRVPLVVYAHGADVRVTAHENWIYRKLASMVARNASAVVTNSRATARLVRELGCEPIIVPPGVDLDLFQPSPRPSTRGVLYLGGRRDHKGYEIAVELADTLAGPYISELAPEELPALIAQHDVVLVPSRAEPFGLVAAEAIACGRWVVASDIDGLRDIVRHGENGFLVADGDFASALQRVPDYDPWVVAQTVQHLGLKAHQRGMADVWEGVSPGR